MNRGFRGFLTNVILKRDALPVSGGLSEGERMERRRRQMVRGAGLIVAVIAVGILPVIILTAAIGIHGLVVTAGSTVIPAMLLLMSG